MRYDLTDLHLFAAVATCGSLTQGAERVHLAPASASARIRRLEENIGTPLFERLPRGVVLTAAGEAMLRHTRRVLGELASIEAELAPFAHGTAGVVRLFANTSALGGHLPLDLASFLARHPQVDVVLEEHDSPTIITALVDGSADIGIVSTEVSGPELSVVPYRQDRLILVCPPDHPLAARTAVAFSETLGEHFISVGGESAMRLFLVARAKDSGRRMRERAQVRSFEAVCKMVAAQAGIAIVPRSAALDAQRALPLALVDLSDTWASREMKLCYRKDQTLTRYQRELLTHLTLVGGQHS